MKLGTLLLRNAAITLSQLETALRTQVLYGGRLGTNLVELGFIDVNTLTTYLGESLDVPVASQDMFESVSPETIERFGAELAKRFEAFPIAHPELNEDVQAVAMVDPSADHSVAELASELGVRVVPHAAPELRIYYYLEHYYGVTRKARYVRVGGQGGGRQFERRRTQPAGGIAIPPKVLFTPSGQPVDEAEPEVRQPAPINPEDLQISYDKARRLLDRTTNRDAIADILLRYAKGRFSVGAIFLLRDNNALGWRLHRQGASLGQYSIEELALPLGPTSALQAAHNSGKPYRGGPLSPGKPTERMLWDQLDITEEPVEMLVVPILVKMRVVNLMYVHAIDGGLLPEDLVTELEDLAERAGKAYAYIINAAKKSAKP